MGKEGIATLTYFIECWRWFTEKLSKAKGKIEV